MAKYSIEDTTLTGIADAIREKTGGSEEIKVEDMAGKIGEISGGSGAVETCTVTIDVSLWHDSPSTFTYTLNQQIVSDQFEHGYSGQRTFTVDKNTIVTFTGAQLEAGAPPNYYSVTGGQLIQKHQPSIFTCEADEVHGWF